MNTQDGFVLGSLDNWAVPFIFSFYASNSEFNQTLAFVLQANLMASIEMLMDDFVGYKQNLDYGLQNS